MNTETILPCIEIEPARAAKYSLIWLHGLGADGNDFAPIVPELNLTNSDIRFIFPNAPVIPITINNGYEMPAWYDIYAIAVDAKTDNEGIARSAAHIGRLIEREVKRGIATHNIFLAGFSQGAAMALTTGIGYHQPLGGIIALSGYLPSAHEISEKANPANQQIPIFLAHGTLDPVLPFGFGLATHAFLKHAEYNVDWHSYTMAHSVCKEEIDDISAWLQGVMLEG